MVLAAWLGAAAVLAPLIGWWLRKRFGPDTLTSGHVGQPGTEVEGMCLRGHQRSSELVIPWHGKSDTRGTGAAGKPRTLD